ncbi:MAG: hypothetical protein N4A74_15305 [Carboxylicivirga sp.]|jgi:exonuclease SbcC|nr:hypothetical protein [Carboxylicivirga sp.]
MKISKVELKAFRAYKELENGTFDFSEKDGTIADFVAIYAPNGFGKTSFFDGVEWCVTNNIYRFTRKHSDNVNLARADQSILKHKQYIIRNKESDNVDGFVRVSTSSDSFIRKIPKIQRNGGRDFKFDESETLKHRIFFRDVLLAQDWIDAFLKEDKPEARYARFMSLFGDSELDEYYKNLNQLINQNDKEIKGLKKEISGIQKKLNLDLDASVLDNVNSIITNLKGEGEELSLIDMGYGQLQEIKLKNKISDRLIELDKDLLDVENAISELSEYEVKIDSYLSNEIKLRDVVESIKQYEKHQEVIRKKQGLLNSNGKNKVRLLKVKRLKNEVESIKNHFEKYTSIVGELSKQLNDKEAKEKKLLEVNKLLKESKLTLSDSLISIEAKYKERNALEVKGNNVPELFEKLKLIKEECDVLEGSRKGKQQKLKILLVENGTLESEGKRICKLEDDFSKRVFTEELYEGKLLSSLKKLKIAYQTQIINDKKLQKVEEQLKLKREINSELKSFLTEGTRIIKETNSNSCPLCQTNFDSVEILLKKVTNNPAFDALEQILLDEKNEIFDVIQKNEHEIKDLNENVYSYIGEKKELNRKAKDHKLIEIKDLEMEIEEVEEKLKSNGNKRNSILIETDNQSKEVLQDKLRSKISAINTALESLQIKKELVEKEEKERLEIIAQLKDNIESIISYNEKLIKDKDYLEIENYRVSKNLERLELSHLNEEIIFLNSESESIDRTIKDEKCEIDLLDKELKDVDEENIESIITRYNNEKFKYNQLILEFEKFLLRKKISKEKKDSKYYKKEFNKLNNSYALRKRSLKYVKLEYSKLEGSQGNIIPYLNQVELKSKAFALEKRYKFKKDVLSADLQGEKDNVSNHIHRQIEDFFHEELINQIYDKIDPHPDYKMIKFNCDFSGNSPKLNVHVSKKGDKVSSSPSLYFSTAQLNILSLSIFLAKALNAKDNDGNDVDCIFLDDPIQSMDSINILSTIDLLRSLSVNYNKQIILSTHEENFYKLLQKKIPSSIYNAKYIELETFGKVKAENS